MAGSSIHPAPPPLTLASKVSEDAKALILEDVAGHDSSHDWFHVERVTRMAQRLAREEGCDDLEMVECAALLHDLKDHKYSGSEDAGPDAAYAFGVKSWGDEGRASALAEVVRNVGFKNEVGRTAEGRDGSEAVIGDGEDDWRTRFPGLKLSSSAVAHVLAIVQDSDRLDAIGAIGIARCLTLGGAWRRTLHDPSVPPRVGMSKEEYAASGHEATTLNHFAEKLVHLRGLMKTEAGRAVAERRHARMLQWLADFHKEWIGEE